MPDEKILSEKEERFKENLDRKNKIKFPFIFTYLIPSFLSTLIFCFVIFTIIFLINKKEISYPQFQIATTSTNFYKSYLTKYTDFFLKNFSKEDDYSSKSVIVYDLTANRSIFEKNPSNQTYIASLTKIATSLALIQHIDLTKESTLDAKDIENEGSALELKEGDKFLNLDLLKASIIASSNQSIMAINEPEETVKWMNDLANALHLRNTTFSNPAGYDDDGKNQSSAKDLIPLAKLFFSNDLLKSLSGTTELEIHELSTQKIYKVHTTNDLVKLQTEGVIGGKTGTTPLAGQNLILYVEKNNRNFLIILLNGADRYVDAYKVLDRL